MSALSGFVRLVTFCPSQAAFTCYLLLVVRAMCKCSRLHLNASYIFIAQLFGMFLISYSNEIIIVTTSTS